MRLADIDVCQSCSAHQPRPSALSSLSLSALGWQQLSFTIHPPTCLILIMVLIQIRLNTAEGTFKENVDIISGFFAREVVLLWKHDEEKAHAATLRIIIKLH